MKEQLSQALEIIQKQQKQIERLQRIVEQQQAEIEELKRIGKRQAALGGATETAGTQAWTGPVCSS